MGERLMFWNILAWLYDHLILRGGIAEIENVTPSNEEKE
jgi:hypothetical protein